jgi:hypothetical protein
MIREKAISVQQSAFSFQFLRQSPDELKPEAV